MHVPRRFYVTHLPGIPTIRVFEALACGIPLISAPWDDAEGLFTPGEDFLVAKDGAAVERYARMLVNEPDFARCAGGAGAGDGAGAAHLRAPGGGAAGDRRPACSLSPLPLRERAGVRGATRTHPGMTRKTLAFYGSSLLSSYWNGAATYYRGILSALHPLGWDITFYEPDAFDRQSHRDIEPPPYATSVVYPATPDGLRQRPRRSAPGGRGGEGQRRRRVRRRADRRHRRPTPGRTR